MSKVTGLGFKFELDTSGGALTDISNDVNDIQFGTPRGMQDVTGLDKSAIERLLLLGDGKVTIKGTYNAALSHTVLSTIPSTSVTRTSKMTLPGGAVLSMEMVWSDYAIGRDATGKLTWTATGDLADGTVPTWA
jgi:hypothetical protein